MDISFLYDIFLSVAFLLVLTVPCFLLTKRGLVGKSAEGVLSAIVLYCCQPLMLVMSFQNAEFSVSLLKNILIAAGLAIAVHAVMILVVMLVFGKGTTDKRLNAIKFASVFSNCGYMGIPFLQMLYGSLGEVIVYAGVVIGVFNLFAWTVGVYIVSGDKKLISFKKAALNPSIIALIVGIILFVAVGKPLSAVAPDGSALDKFFEKLTRSLNFFGDMVTPLSMSVIGIKLAGGSIKKVFLNSGAYVSSLFKLAVMPILTVLIVAFLPIDQTVKNAVVFTLSMPSATMTALFAISFGGDGETATASVLLSTLLSVVSIPLIYLLLSALTI